MPLSAFVVEATPDKPYLGFKLNLDPPQLCDIITQTGAIASKKENSVRGLFVSNADESLLDCALRLTRLLDTPQDISILAPMIIREIYYRLLMGEQGESVRQIATIVQDPNNCQLLFTNIVERKIILIKVIIKVFTRTRKTPQWLNQCH